MDTTVVRLIAQMLLLAWCTAMAAMLLIARGRTMQPAGQGWALLGLASFGGWMFLSALSIKDTALFPRSAVLWIFAMSEVGTAAGAWGWLLAYVHRNFHVRVHLGARRAS